MKMIVIIMTTCLLQVSAASFAQKVTLVRKNIALSTLFAEITRQTGYEMLYSSQVDKSIKLDVNFNGTPLKEVLENSLEKQGLTFTIEDKIIVVKPKEPTFLERLAERWADRDVRGRVVDEQGNPMPNASIQIKGTSKATTSNDKGEFVFKDVADDAVLVIRYVGYKALEIPVKGASMPLEIKLNQLTGQLEEVAVKGNTGYQVLEKNHPGSFDVIDNKLLNRRVSSYILDRIENLTPGISFKNPNDGILIRGRSSIYSDVRPLIVIDNFPYDGDINNINPNDVESVTILKDAAAASIWGAKAGNGVIVLTTKTGKSNRLNIDLVSNATFSGRPDLNKIPTISTNEYIDLEKVLFNNGFYDAEILDVINNRPLTPVVETLAKLRKGLISESVANDFINSLRSHSVNDDLERYFYRSPYTLQNSLNFSGQAPKVNYYISAGWDKTLNDLIGSSVNRLSLRTHNTFTITSKLQFHVGFNYVQNNNKNGINPGNGINSGAGKGLYPYADLVDENGQALALVKNYRSSFVDTLGKGKIQSWLYKPYDDINKGTLDAKAKDILVNLGIKYNLLSLIDFDLKYQIQNSSNASQQVYNQDSYFVRDMINTFYQPKNNIHFPVPIGGIIDNNLSNFISHQGRAQLNFKKNVGGKHDINAILGWEIRDSHTKGNSNRLYGYQKTGNVVIPTMDFVTQYPVFSNPGITSHIQNPQGVSELRDRFISSFFSGVYVYNNKYVFSVSAREDAANLFGVTTNNKGIPLWSIGTSWLISDEAFFKANWINRLSLRTTYGVNGNYSRVASANLVTAIVGSANGNPSARILNPPNSKLRWEKTATFNLGLDFAVINNRINGSIEFFQKKGSDLMGLAPVDPTLGVLSNFFTNVAGMSGRGYELNLNTKNIVGSFNWNTNLISSYALNKVSKYLVPTSESASAYIASGGSIVPIIGKPIYSVFSYKWAGLDANSGDPLGYYNNNLSKDYTNIIAKTSVDSIAYGGASQPAYFGSMRNSFSFKNLEISVNISYKLGYSFKRNSISYSNLFDSWSGHSDYAKRWQAPGDESYTSIPSLVFADHAQFKSRDSFYASSEALIEKGDHIRLEDISLSYKFPKSKNIDLPFRDVRIYTYISNLGIIWRSNDKDVDPYFLNGNINKPNFSFGINVGF